MDSSISILRLFSVLAVFMALVISLFARQVGAAAAQGAADAAAIAVTDLVRPDWDCTEANLPTDAAATAARAAVARTAQLAAVHPTAVEVRADGTCSVIVTVRVESAGWLGSSGALGIACRRPTSAEGAALRAPVAPPC
ncbi:MAG: hypothetical protein F4117_02790 [Acidimicrobiales bacterium]|nr:hypothetical protein [Acidimicrobiaceae bacterium]MXV87190.1 hypothetical protein [Acidimicrobiales bacterium]MYA26817.1 hypothetical protein [Acidimicrobiales bacterium]MYB81653.1 hypothetical protein [Acidimicrobiales bacterium]MYD83410.1 hypothetical protein [Acidimicrobiales bacterium]